MAALAKMARLDVSAEEAAAWAPKIAAIVEWFGQLRDVDVSGVEPLPRGGEAGATPEELVLRLRPDEHVSFAHREELLAAAANLEAPYLRIPKILEDTSS